MKLVVLPFVVWLLMLGSNGEIVRWRFPGLSSDWLNPHNWVSESGQYRVPRPQDHVVISGTAFPGAQGNGVYQVYLQSEDAVQVQSLSLDESYEPSGCAQCDRRTSYYYNGTSWVSQLLFTPCANTLVVVGPTELTVTTNISIGIKKRILAAVSATNTSSLSTIVTGGMMIEYGGFFVGSAQIEGNVTSSGTLQVIAVDSNEVVFSSDYGGTLTVGGDLVISNSGNIKLSAEPKDFSFVSIQGKFSCLPTTANLDIYYIPERNTSAVFNLLFGSTDLNVTQMVLLNDTNDKLDSLDPYCFNSPKVIFVTSSCVSTSSHNVGVLLGQIQNDCPPSCPGTPECNNHGSCGNNPPECICYDGWEGYACEIPVCPGSPECSNHGWCEVPSSGQPYCSCDQGWQSEPDCSVPSCPNNCTSPTHGICDSSGNVPQCVCFVGWQLGPNRDCSERSSACPGLVQQCSAHGTCDHSIGTCNCSQGWIGADCSLPLCPNGCNHHGECVDDGQGNPICNCSIGWTGNDCSVGVCPNGCSGHGYCSVDLDPPRCICDAPTTLLTAEPNVTELVDYYGWTGVDCSVGMPPKCTATSCNGATCDQTYGICLLDCPSGFTDWDCSKYFCWNTGIPECHGHGACQLVGSTPQCECAPGFVLGPNNDCRFANCEINGCSGHGTCRTDLAVPTCECDPFYYGSDCSISTCPGTPECSGQGQCVNGSCICGSGWQGLDCSVVRCAQEGGNNCNLRGYCNDSTDPPFCDCFPGWTGSACQIGNCLNNCSGHGYCDESSREPFCYCDQGWTGQDCSSPDMGGTDTNQVLEIVLPVVFGLALLITLGVIGGVLIWIFWGKIGLLLKPHPSAVFWDESLDNAHHL